VKICIDERAECTALQVCTRRLWC